MAFDRISLPWVKARVVITHTFPAVLLGLLGLLILPNPSSAQPERTADESEQPAEAAFEDLKALVGNWKVQGSDAPFFVSFELIANQTVLVETWHSKGVKKSLTIYHLDQDRLLATHYCPQGNQPRLAMKPIETAGRFSFEFLDATNLPNPGQSHQHSLTLDRTDPSGLLHRSETYRNDDQTEQSSLILERIEP